MYGFYKIMQTGFGPFLFKKKSGGRMGGWMDGC